MGDYRFSEECAKAAPQDLGRPSENAVKTFFFEQKQTKKGEQRFQRRHNTATQRLSTWPVQNKKE